MSDERVAAAVRALADTVPVPDPPPIAVPREVVRPRRWPPVLAATAVLAVLVAIAVVPAPRPGGPRLPAANGGAATLPDRFADWSALTADVTRAPAGRAVAVYGLQNPHSEDLWSQVLVV